MGKILPEYIMDCGVLVENSYWIPTQVILDKLEKHVQITMTGFRDYESRMTGHNVIGSQGYNLWGAEATNYINKSVAGDMNSLAYAYEYVADKSIPVKIGINGEIEQRSLFVGAVDMQDDSPYTEEETVDGEDTEGSIPVVVDDGTAWGEVEEGDVPIGEESVPGMVSDEDEVIDQELDEFSKLFDETDEEIPEDVTTEEVSEEVEGEVVDETESYIDEEVEDVTDETVQSSDTAMGENTPEEPAEKTDSVEEDRAGEETPEQYWES